LGELACKQKNKINSLQILMKIIEGSIVEILTDEGIIIFDDHIKTNQLITLSIFYKQRPVSATG